MESAKSVDSDVSKESNEEMAEEGSEKSSQSKRRNKGRRDPLVEKPAEIIIAREALLEVGRNDVSTKSRIFRGIAT